MTQPIYGFWTREQCAGLDGLAQMRLAVEGKFPQAPMTAVLGMRLTSAERGRVIFHGTPTADHLNTNNVVHGGWAFSILDTAMAYAVQSTLPTGRNSASIEMKINFLRPVLVTPDTYVCEATALGIEGDLALAEGFLRDGAGNLVAHASESCIIRDVII